MYFSPTDEEVETVLGLKLGSWSANPEPIVVAHFVKAAKPENVILSSLMVLGVFAIACVLAYFAVVFSKSTIIGGITFLIAFIPGLLIHGKISAVAHARATLGIFEKGLRLGSSIFRFDELSAITLGAPDSFDEKYFPTLKKAGEAVAEIKVGVEMMQASKNLQELIKATTLTFHLKNGKVKTWPAFGTYFEPQDTREFITLLSEAAPEELQFQTDSE